MQYKLAAFITAAAMATLAASTQTPTPNGGSGPNNQCNNGSLLCCESTQDTKSLDKALLGLLKKLGISVTGLTGQVGVACSSITLGAATTSCSTHPVCCTNNSFNGAVALGCTPFKLST